VRQRKKLGKLKLQGTRWVGLRTGNSDNMKILPIDIVSCKSQCSIPLSASGLKQQLQLKYFFAWLTSLEMHPTTCKIIKDGAQSSLI